MKITIDAEDAPQVLSVTEDVVDNTTLRSVFTRLAEKNEYFREKIFDPVKGKMKQEFFVLMNGKLCPWNTALEIQVKNSDELEFLPLVAGG